MIPLDHLHKYRLGFVKDTPFFSTVDRLYNDYVRQGGESTQAEYTAVLDGIVNAHTEHFYSVPKASYTGPVTVCLTGRGLTPEDFKAKLREERFHGSIGAVISRWRLACHLTTATDASIGNWVEKNLTPSDEYDDFWRVPNEPAVQVAPLEQEIRKACKEMADFLVEKNRKYGNSVGDPVRVFAPEVTDDLLFRVRMDDKLSRIRTASPGDEEDPYQDLAGYIILRRALQLRGTK